MKLFGLKWNHYEGLYCRHLSGESILEVGVWQGASLARHRRMGFKHVFGIDNRVPPKPIPGCCIVKASDIELMKSCGDAVYVGSIRDKEFMGRVKESISAQVGKIDCIIDDASHWPFDQHSTFKTLWPLLAEGGVYCIEDLQVSMKLKWRLWQYFGLPSVMRLLFQIYHQQHQWSGIPESQPIQRPYEIHIYPNIIFIKKVTSRIRVVDTAIEA